MQADVTVWWEAVRNISLRYLLFASGTFVLFYLLLRPWLGSRRIQRAFPRWSDYRRDLLFSLLSIAIFSSLAYLCVGVLRPWNHFIYGTMQQVSLTWHLLSFAWLFVLHDAYFYWVHRLMHHPVLFRRVHLVHHRSTNPSPWTAYAFHPLEALLEAGIIPLAAFTVPVHLRLFSLFMLFQIAYNVYGHLGYELFPHRTARHWLGRWINTSVAHNQHHKHFKGNYGLYTLIWDRLFGTLRPDYTRAMDKYGQDA